MMKSRSVFSLLATVLFVLGLWESANAEKLSSLFQKVSPSVVVIKTVSQHNVTPSSPRMERFVREEGLGSGVLISDDGFIMTAAHVVQTADVIVVAFVDGQKISARVVSSAPYADVALLKLKSSPKRIEPAKLGDSDEVMVGDKVFVIGAPYGLNHTLTVGHISARHIPKTVAGNLALVELFQTDAAINSGNSGGPMFNMNGEVIGIVSHILSKSGGFEGIGFAVTLNTADKLIREKSFWSGIDGYMLTGKLAKVFNLPQLTGLLVQHVAVGSPGSRLGLEPGSLKILIEKQELLVGGDIILEVAGKPLSTDIEKLNKIRSFLNALKPGDKLSVKVLRGGKIIKLSTHIE